MLIKNSPYPMLLRTERKSSGRNNIGTITVRHRGCGHKRLYRTIDFYRNKDYILGKVEKNEYDPNRSANIVLVLYADGERRYIIAPNRLPIGSVIVSGRSVPSQIGNSLSVGLIYSGTNVHCIELVPANGAKLSRAAGSYATIISNASHYTQVRLMSGEVRLINKECRATVGIVGNIKHSLSRLDKAGKRRWLGIRPTVRGVAMNPIDHPHGGGEGKTTSGRHPVSPWGTPTKGFKTRNNKQSDSYIINKRR
ncbi:50S ribosomal protein L2 [Candidatus Tremblaya phenacola]|uniref:Large ribosomal subunit protein uL2 n=1 Tax=Candidatus Tremblayella phenacoccinincola TaxID=1010676 RepID=A0A2G0V6X7_9PROT|nr:50S ribosomal protein L2 [Candidatus Tremblaya phenacola]PHN16212.1 50S ribosomal protein L2 [Candidatus Tremblaya phenacola]